MNEIKHHLTDALLMAYSAGTLPEGFNLVVATHISMCDECRARMMEFDTVGGAVMDAETPANVSDESFAATLELIAKDDTALHEPVAETPARNGLFPSPLQDYVGGDLDAVKWRRVGGGVRQAILKTDKSASVRLLHIPAGVAVPDHGHRGTELTLVLQGAFRDESDRFATGDIEVATDELDHQPVAEEGMDCICLAATDAPLRFNSWIPKIAQPFLRI
ncbi:ChrR family anti-sigma-E factor [Pseudooctadecabacter jejudonensis]|uniref:Anti-sigma-E factor ChrR n=1 Tax=Pseudooctadecabacter jejudonensis TaxID=1391910 RepID=A0A1Y5SAC8_9RHOB|nr:ChrR family anti-sigma-E factor [Pseudooctadecabacter jejudonensis]SLN36229.1 Anti-sigma-E factor ChrR [Pseudooctadecabacter jejudonensis]